MGYEDLFGALGRRIAPDLVDDGPIEPQTIIDRLTRKGINDIENPRPRAVEPARAPAPKARTLSDQMNDFDPAPRPEGDRSLKDQLSDFDNMEAPIPRPRPEKAGDGFSASEIPLPNPRPDVGPAPVTGGEVVEPALEAPFRTGGSALDKVFGTEGGMLSGKDAYEDKYGRPARDAVSGVPGLKDVPAQEAMPGDIGSAKAALDRARADRKLAEERRQKYIDEFAPVVEANPQLRARMEADATKDSRIDEAIKREKAAEAALQKAQKEAPSTQKGWRDIGERVVRSAASMPGQVARTLQGGMESSPIPVEAQLFSGPKAEQVRREGSAGMAKLAERAEKWAGDVARPDPTQDEDFTGKLAEGATSMAMFMAGGVASRALGASAALGSAGLGALQMGGQQFKEADDALKTLNQRIDSYKSDGVEPPADLVAKRDQLAKTKYIALYAGAGLGATEAIPIERFFDALNRASKGKVSSILAETTAQSLTEYAQEVGQQIGSNFVARLYEENRPLFKDVQDSGAVALVLGGLMGAGAGTVGVMRRGGKGNIEAGIPTPDVVPPPTQEELERQAKGEPPATLPPGVQTQGGAGGGGPAETLQPPAQAIELASEKNGNSPDFPTIRPEPAPGNTPPPPAAAVAAPPAPSPPAPAATHSQADATERAILRAYGYNDEQIADMPASQRRQEVQDAIESGVDPDEAVKADKAMSGLASMFGQDEKAAGTKAAPVKVETEADIEKAAQNVAEQPTEGQKKAENYEMGHIRWPGVGQISIETRRGGTRTAKDNSWSVPNFPAHYGRIKGTIGADGQQVDAFMGGNPNADTAYVINQIDPATGKFDETKVMLGFADQASAIAAYDAGFSDGSGAARRQSVVPVGIPELKAWAFGPAAKKAFPVPKARDKTLPKPTGVLSLLQFIASRGGMRIDPDLRSMALPRNIVVPGMGHRSLLRSGGMSRDQVLEAAREAGYLPPAPSNRPDDIGVYRQLLDMLDEENRGRKSYPQGREPTGGRTEEAAAEQSEADRDKLMALFIEAGVDVDTVEPLDLIEAERIMRAEGVDAHEALQMAAMRATLEENMLSEAEFDNLYGEEWWDAVQTEPALQDGADTQVEGVEDRRPGKAGSDDAQSGDVSGTREDRGEQGEKAAGIDDVEGATEAGQAAEAAKDREQVDGEEEFKTVDEFLDHVESEIAAGRYNADIAPTRDLKEFRAAAEARGWTYGPYGKGKALWSPDRKIAMFSDVSVEGNHVQVQWGTPFDGVTPPPVTEKTGAGEQTVLPGAEKIGQGEQAQRDADKPLKPKKAQKPADEGLFGDDSKQTDLIDEIKKAPETGPSDSGTNKAKSGWTEIGKNAKGQTLYEDERGVRSRLEGGVRITEPVTMRPTRSGMEVETNRTDKPEWQTVDEAKPADGIDADVKSAFDDIFAEKEKKNAAPKAEKPAATQRKREFPSYTSEELQQFLDTEPNLRPEIRERMRAEIEARESGESQPRRTPQITPAGVLPGGTKTGWISTPPSKADLAKSAAKKAGSGTKKSIEALGELFGGKNKLSMGVSFDSDTYAKAKPIFLDAVSDFAGAFNDIAELARILVDEVEKAFGWDAVKEMRPYLERFVQDVKDGTIDLKSATISEQETADEPASTGSQDQAPLEDVPSEEGAGTPGKRDSERGDSGDSEARPGGIRQPQAAGVSGPRGGGSGSGKVRVPKAGAGSGRAGLGARGASRNGSAVSSQPASDSGLTPAEAPGNVPAVNFRITNEVELGKGTEGEKFRDNLDAIRALKTIEKENRRATAEEQRALARYVGWGGLANAFADREGNFKDGLEKRGSELSELLTPEELAAARRSTRNAHYTSETLVNAMWKAAKQLGFKGGLVLESSMGTGNFLGLIPQDIAGRSRFVGIEYDSLTARIAKALYPQETILHSALQDVPLPDGEFTLNIGNPPFGSESLRFQYKPELSGHSIHNQFFMAGLDALRPDGLQILVVSRFLMDAQDSSARTALAKKGELLGAIRLPGTAFVENARTEVVTDVVFIRRRSAEEEAAITKIEEDIRDKKNSEVMRNRAKAALAEKLGDWIETAQVADPLGGDPITVNKYFAKRRAMILGSLERSGSMRAQNDITVNLKDGDLAALLDQAIEKLPIDVQRMGDEAIDNTLERVKTMGESLEIALSGEEPGNLAERDGKLVQTFERETPTGGQELTRREITPQSPWSRDLYMDDKGQWYTLTPAVDEKGEKVKQGKRNVYEKQTFTDATLPASKRLGEAKFARLKDMVKLRDLVKRQLVLESEDAPAKEMEANRKKLAAAYKDFVAKHDLLNTPSNAALVSDMPDGALVMALEINYRPGMTAARAARRGEKPVKPSADPAPIMERRVVPKYEPATKADSTQDAIQISMSERGVIDIERVASLLGITPDEVAAKLQEGDSPLAFFDPESKTWETRDNYLSGQVVKKLKAAQNEGLEKNIRALEAVQPEPWTAEQVNVVVGATWVPADIYAKFAEFLTGGRSSARFLKATNSFAIQLEGVNANKATQWGVEGAMTFRDIFSRMLNSQSLKVIVEDREGNKSVDQEATALVGLKAREIENEFADWIFADGERRSQLVSIFNEKFNTRVNRQHDGTHLQLPGKVPDEVIALRRHQKNAVWRGIHERFMLLDHVVGAGKTFTAIARIMERRRMGLSRKPMVAVPNHLVEQWAADVYRLYPGAKVLAAGKNQFDRKNRRRLFAKIATGDWDIVIVPHSSFGFIGISPVTETRFLENELRIAEDAIKEAQEAAVEDGLANGRRKPHNVKEAERLAERIKARLDALKAGKTDRLLTFEQMGVDDLTVDEAHEFKNLFYSSRLTGVRGMGDKTGSTKAFGLYNKVRVLREHPTGTVTFMTGTPISNSAVEMYTMMRYLAADELRELGLEHFDAWRTQSVSAETRFEPTESGSGLKEVSRLGRSWSNMRALMELWYSFTDAVPQEDISKWYAEDNDGKPFPIPRVKGGGRKEVVVKPTAAQERILAEVVQDFNDLPSISDPDERNATRLRLMDRARKLSLDARAVDPTLDTEEYGGKLDRMADEIDRIYRATAVDKGTQLVFLDRGVKSSKGDKAIIKEYDDLIAKRDEARAKGDEEAYRNVLDKLDEFNPTEIEELRRAQNGGWNAYDQLKNNLVKRGIPADQIRFIQEANNDAEKKALFDAVNDGTVRILIGSTPRMGAGTNVQERIVALHHGDVTYKPSDIEQREGRGIRQGNKLLEKYGHDKFELEILAYVTERTVDAKMWDLNSTKLKMINGIRKYDGSFTMDFEDDDAVGMAEIAALASGDPLLLERVKLTSEIDKLELQERAHRRKQFGLDDQIDTYNKIIRDYPALIEKYQAAAEQVRPEIEAVEERAKGRSITIAGTAYTSAIAAEQAFETEVSKQSLAAADKAMAELEAKAKAEGREPTSEERGKVTGRAYKYSVDVNGKQVTSKSAAEEEIGASLGDSSAFEAEVEGSTVTRRSRVARVVAELASEYNATINEGSEKSFLIGKIYGHDLELQVKYVGARTEVALVLKDGKNEIAEDSRYFDAQKEISVAGARALLDNLLLQVSRIAEFKDTYMRAKITEAQEGLPALKEQQGKPFSLADELTAKRGRLQQITEELAARAEEAEKGRRSNPQEEPQANIRQNAVQLRPEVKQRKADIAAMLQRIVRLVAGPQARVEFAESLPVDQPLAAWGEHRRDEEGVTAGGLFVPAENLITLALNDPKWSLPAQISTAFHEAFHSIERFLLHPQELAVMRSEDARLRKIVQDAFGFSDSQIASIAGYEIRAMAFEHYVDQRSRGLQATGMHVAIRRAFERIMQMLRQIRNALHGMGFQTTEDIFESALQGEIGQRGVTQSRTMMDVMREMEEQYSARKVSQPRKFGIPVSASTPIAASANDQAIKSHPDYRAAKAGDDVAAANLVRDRVPADMIEQVRQQIGPDAVYVPVIAQEQSGHNAIPATLAEYLAEKTGGTTVNDIVQVNQAFHTGAKAMERLSNRAIFEGTVTPGARYVLVDDVTVMGSTLADLADHIQSNGGIVAGVVVLANAGRSGVLTASKPAVRDIERRFGDVLRQEFGIDPSGLTADEATYLRNFKDADALRDRIASAKSERDLRLRSKGVRQEGVDDDVQYNIRQQNERRGAAPEPERIADKLHARNLPKLASISQALGFGKFRPTEARTQVQDKFIRVKKLQQAQEKATGPVPERMDTYGAESLYYGRTGEQIERLDRQHIDPLIREIKNRGLTLEQVDDYLYARHAPARNERMRAINPNVENGSGMSDEEAAAILDAIPPDKLADYQAIERRVRAIIDQTNETRLRGGLISQETLDKWNAAYPDGTYIPMRGFNENAEEVEDDFLHVGSGFDVRGPESRRALGRDSRAAGPLAYVISQAQEAIVRAEKDRVGRTFLRYAQANPNPGLWTINTPPTKRVISPLTGMVVEVADPAWIHRPDVFAVKVGGKPHYIQFHGENGKDIARGLKNIGTAQVHAVIRFFSALTRLFARMQTAWNTEFWFSNLPRDVGEALINLQAQDQKRFSRLFLKYLIPSIGGAFRGQMGKFEGRYSKAFEEFDKAGGRIRFFGLEDPDDIRSNVASKLRRLEGGTVNSIIGVGEKAIEGLEIAGGAIENATRLAAYMAARDVGLTQAQAAKIGRELTVNFNRKGELGGAISALYAFANAGVQGIVRSSQALKHKRVRRMAYGLAAAGALLALYNIGAGGDDDDKIPLYEKIPPWDRDKNFIFMWPKGWGKKGQYSKIPIPFGFGYFHVIGARIASYLYGATTKEKALSSILKSLVDAYDPIGRDENMVAQFAPTVTRPGVHLYTNKNWTGRPINPENPYGRDHRPDSERYFDSASKFSIAAAKQMNSMSGGSPYKSGYIDVSPGTLDYMMNFLGGGVGRFVAGSVATPWKLYQGEEIKGEKTPIARRFYGKVDTEAFDRNDYYENRNEARDAPISLARKAAKRGEPGAVEALQELSKNATRADLGGEQLFDKVDRQISKLRSEERRIQNDASLSEIDRKQKIEENRAEINTLRNQARSLYRGMKAGTPSGTP